MIKPLYSCQDTIT